MAGTAFYTSATGLRNHQLRIDATANNIANVNTTGYKASSVIFSDVLSQTLRGASAPSGGLGGINPKQIGLGMQVAAIHNLMQQSALENTSRPTDFAINGSGFFILSDGREEIYTRAGDFVLDRDGRLVSGEGLRVQGYNQVTADGTAIDHGKGLGDILIEFGKKIEAKPSTWLTYASNLDSASFRYGSANNESSNVGTTGILTFAGAAEPWTTVVGSTPVTNFVAASPTETITINGNNVVVPSDPTVNYTAQEMAENIADAINIDPTLSVQVQASVRQVGTDYYLVLQGVNPGTTIDITAVGPYSGLAVGTFQSPPEPGPYLVGNNTITVTDAKAAVVTTSVPVGTGVNAPIGPVPGPADSFLVNGEVVTLTQSYAFTNTAAQNAVIMAGEINAQCNSVVATANPNGTLTLTHAYEGKQRQPDQWGGPPAPAWADWDIVLDFSASAVGVEQRMGFNSVSGWEDPDFGGVGSRMGGVDNGLNARAELVFTPDDQTPPITRFVEDWSYDRSTAPLTLLGGFTYGNSDLANVQSAIGGASATFPLMPGVNISIDELSAGQANFRTEDAYIHTTSRIVYDSLGAAHNLTTTFTHVNENEWEFVISLPEEPNITLSNTTGRLTFSPDGLLTSGNPNLEVQFTGPGASPTSIQLIFDGQGQTLRGITQYSAATTTAAREQDGYAMGVLSDFEADSSGTIVAFYDNGQRRPIAQVSLATFNNPEGLDRVGSTNFRQTTNSGAAVHLQPGTGGAGAIFNGYIEQSNVDLALEFTNLIITQRGLQANSRVFTTQDEILNEIVNMKR